MGKALMDAWNQSTIIQGLLALVFAVTLCYLYLNGKTPPTELLTFVGLILGYYFGFKSAQIARSVVNGMNKVADDAAVASKKGQR